MLFYFPQQPGAGESPKPSRRSERDSKLLCCLFVRETDKETKLHQISRPRIDDCEAIQCSIQREQFIVRHGQWNIDGFHINPFEFPAMFEPLLSACRLDENPPHGLRRRAEEMRAIFKPRLFLGFKQSQPRFMNEGRGLQRMAGRFPGHFVRGETAQFVIDKRQQLVGGCQISLFNCVQDAGNFTQSIYY